MKLTFPSILTLIFITLKLTNYIDWSWWWILAPSWIGLVIGLLLLMIAALAAVIAK